MTKIDYWAEEAAKKVHFSTEASAFLKDIFETSDNVVLYDFFKNCETIADFEQAAIDIFRDELTVGATYEDPEGIFEIVAINEKTVDVKQVQENLNFNHVYTIPIQEALFYICKQ